MEEENKKEIVEKLISEEKKVEELKINIKEYFIHLFDIKAGTNKAGTIQDIKDGISIKGHTAWLLILSILIASIGLNVSSPAVVIGAMLIAPLMGPILGMGLSIAINDFTTLKKSLLNFVAMVIISLITSFLFFSIPLFQEATPELLARTKPDLRDVLIAIVGGLALIVSLSRRKEMTNTLAGVAIATALMPPICTAGYGLAIGNMNYFLGAFFLFIINSNFIALATYIILKFLKFKRLKKSTNKNQTTLIRLATVFTVVVFSLSIFTFYNLYLEKKFNSKANSFISKIKEKGVNIIDIDKDDFSFKQNSILITVFGNALSQKEQKEVREILSEVNLESTNLIIQQGKDNSSFVDELNDLRDSYTNQLDFLNSKENIIQAKEKTILKLSQELSTINARRIPFKQISKEAKINYSGLKSMSFSNRISTNFNTIDTISIFNTTWYDTVPNTDQQYKTMQNWLKTRLNMDTFVIEKK